MTTESRTPGVIVINHDLTAKEAAVLKLRWRIRSLQCQIERLEAEAAKLAAEA